MVKQSYNLADKLFVGFLWVLKQPTRKLQAGSVIGNNYISGIMETGEHCWWTVVSPSFGEKSSLWDIKKRWCALKTFCVKKTFLFQ